MKNKVFAVVCADSSWGIGNKNGLLIHIPEDMKFFKELTTGNIVVMGRKTYDSLPVKPLPNRLNVVITSKVDEVESNENGVLYMTMDYAKKWITNNDTGKDICIIGGGQIYRELMPLCTMLYVTRVKFSFIKVDTYFPNIDKMPEWELSKESEEKEYKGFKYQFCQYKKKI